MQGDRSVSEKVISSAYEFFHAAAYSAFQAPVSSIAGMIDHEAGTQYAKSLDFVPTLQSAQLGTADWFGQQLGQAVGMFLGMKLFAGRIGAKAECSALSISSNLAHGAAGGFAYGFLTNPVAPESRDFWQAHVRNGIVGGVSGVSLAATTIGLRAASHLIPESLLSTTTGGIGAQIGMGMLAGFPAGAASAETDSLLQSGNAASSDQVWQSICTNALVGGALAGFHLQTPKISSSSRSNIFHKLRANIGSAAQRWSSSLSVWQTPQFGQLAPGGVGTFPRPPALLSGRMDPQLPVKLAAETVSEKAAGVEPVAAKSLVAATLLRQTEKRTEDAVGLIHPTLPSEQRAALAYALSKEDVSAAQTLINLDAEAFKQVYDHIVSKYDPQWFHEAVSSPSGVQFWPDQAVKALPLAQTFGSRWEEWLTRNNEIHLSEGERFEPQPWLITGTSDPRLGTIMIANVDHPLPLLQLIAKSWQSLPDATRQQSFESIARSTIGQTYGAHLPTLEEMATTTNPFRYKFLEGYAHSYRYLLDPSTPYADRMVEVRRLSMYLQGSGQGDLPIPILRMPIERTLSAAERAQARTTLEASLWDSDSVRGLFRTGLLGRLFPKAFGDSAESIVERNQGATHEFPVGEHTVQVMEHIRDDPSFAVLSKKEQADLLLAALMHDIGKEPGGHDPQHELVSSDMTYGILGTFGYPPQRIARIANLVRRHSDAGYKPEEDTLAKLQSTDTDWSLVAHYRRPQDPLRLQILNRADIRGINAVGSYYTENVSRHLDEAKSLLEARALELNRNAIPILTSALPTEFGLYMAPKDFVLLAHTSPDIDNFIRQRGALESPNASLSAALITRKSMPLYHDYGGPKLVALLSAPMENVAQAHRSGLYTNYKVNDVGHVELMSDWARYNYHAQSFVDELDKRIAALDSSHTTSPAIMDTHDLWTRLAPFDTLDDLAPGSSEQQAAHVVAHAMTHNPDGSALSENNEVKLSNPTLALGIVRRGANVVFENADSSVMARLLHGAKQPDWLISRSSASASAPAPLVIAESLWRDAIDQHVPLIVLD